MSKIRTLKGKITKIIIGISLLQMIVFFLVACYVIKEVIIDRNEEISRVSIENFSLIMETKNREVSELLSVLANIEGIKILKENTYSQYLIQNIIEEFENKSEGIYNIYIITEEGTIFDDVEDGKKKIDEIHNWEWYEERANNNSSFFVNEPFLDNRTGEYIYSYMKGFYVEEELLGIIVIDVPLKNTMERMPLSKWGKSNSPFRVVISNDGIILRHDNKDLIGKNQEECIWIKEIIKNTQKGSCEVDINEQRYKVYIEENKATGFIYCILNESIDYNELVLNQGITIIIFLGITFIIVFLISRNFSKKIAKETEEVGSLLKIMKTGKFSKEIEENIQYDEYKKIISIYKECVTSINWYEVKNNKSLEKLKSTSKHLLQLLEEGNYFSKEEKNCIRTLCQDDIVRFELIEKTKEMLCKLTRNMENVKNTSIDTKDISIKVFKEMKEGLTFIDELNLKYEENIKTSKDVIKRICSLEENSYNISKITTKIKEINEQINLLAVNLSIESSRPNGSGKEFGVFSEEVRKLAEQSSKYTIEIGDIVTNIDDGIKSVTNKSKELVSINNLTVTNIEKLSRLYDYMISLQSTSNNIIEENLIVLEMLNKTEESLQKRLEAIYHISIKVKKNIYATKTANINQSEILKEEEIDSKIIYEELKSMEINYDKFKEKMK